MTQDRIPHVVIAGATRTPVGLRKVVFDDEHEALRRGYERARQMAKDVPYSRDHGGSQ